MRQFELLEFLPPIVPRALRYFARKRVPSSINAFKYSPFDSLPASCDAKLILDVGANIGDFAESALKSYKDCHVICFEPVTNTYGILQRRLSKYGKRVILHNIALSSTNDVGSINITNLSAASSISPQADFHKACNPHVHEVAKQQIKLARLDDFFAASSLGNIDIMKIDVEGHELDVLQGGLQTITQCVDYLIVEVSFMRDQSDSHQSVYDIFALMNEAGFKLQNILDLHRTSDGTGQLAQMDCVFRRLPR